MVAILPPWRDRLPKNRVKAEPIDEEEQFPDTEYSVIYTERDLTNASEVVWESS